MRDEKKIDAKVMAKAKSPTQRYTAAQIASRAQKAALRQNPKAKITFAKPPWEK